MGQPTGIVLLLEPELAGVQLHLLLLLALATWQCFFLRVGATVGEDISNQMKFDCPALSVALQHSAVGAHRITTGIRANDAKQSKRGIGKEGSRERAKETTTATTTTRALHKNRAGHAKRLSLLAPRTQQ